MKRLLKSLFVLAFFAAIAAAGCAYFLATGPMRIPAEGALLAVKQGGTLRGVGRQLQEAGYIQDARIFWALARVQANNLVLKPGNYKLTPGLTPMHLLDKLALGKPEVAEVQFLEGSRFKQMRAALRERDDLKPDARGLSDIELLKAIGATAQHPEGLFFPDTYQIEPASSELEVYRRAHKAMQVRLNDAWEKRSPSVPLKTAYEVLIMASIIEKETGVPSERARIAGVFYNRLRVGMRLQTDPTVIYGLGDAFDGNLRRKDLQTDTPWNTYTRDGLPPSPIALPSLAAIQAATQPESNDYFYFVGKGDGSHYFSKTLEEHNRAVNKYQRGG